MEEEGKQEDVRRGGGWGGRREVEGKAGGKGE